MNDLYEKKEILLRLYAEKSKYIDKIVKFLLALMLMIFIGSNIGFLPVLSNPAVVVGISLVCAFMPVPMMAVLMMGIVLAEYYSWAMGCMIVAACVFLLFFILCLRFTPNRTWLVLFVPVAFMLKVPAVIPLVCGLIGTPVWFLPIACGTMAFYMIHYVSMYGAVMGDAVGAGLISQLTSYSKLLFTSKELLFTVIVLSVCLWVVYELRRMVVDNAWKIAIVAGCLLYIVAMVVGSIMLKLEISYVSVVLGSLMAAVVSFVLEFFIFSVDYSRTEYLQFEDDEYYYYVKAVPKISVAAPKKTVKRINERQDTSAIDADAVNKAIKKPVLKDEGLLMEETDELLLAKTLEDELDIQKLIEEELKN